MSAEELQEGPPSWWDVLWNFICDLFLMFLGIFFIAKRAPHLWAWMNSLPSGELVGGCIGAYFIIRAISRK